MGVTCPACGMLSQDAEFCDHCNTDLAPPAVQHVPFHCPLLAEGVRLTAEERTLLARPESSLLLTNADRFCRVHWLPSAELNHWLPLLDERARFRLEALPSFQRREDDQGLWIVVESSGRPAQPWTTPINDVREDLRHLLRHVRALSHALEELHAHNLVWLNFDPAELELGSPADSDDLRLFIANMDLEVYPAGYCPEHWNVKPAFAAPEVCRGLAEDIGPRTDVFHLALFCYYWLAKRLPGGFAGAGLESFGFMMPPLRIFAPDLPPGLAGVLARGLAVDPPERYATPTALASALEETLGHLERRWSFDGPLTWEIGTSTRIGRAKEALQGANEDAVLIREFADPPRALLAVADGITTCDVGNGALASSLTLDLLGNRFGEGNRSADFPVLITVACDQAARALLQWAHDNGHEASLRQGQDLMGTTLIAGWLEGHHLNLSNIGDSRAYLIQGKTIEQLTVDGDLGCALLAAGTPPEQVRELGGLGKALRECVGGCHLSPTGELQPLPDCFPTLTQFRLLPGEILVLCSDGLVEEGAFLDPRTLLELVRQHHDLSASDLANLLVERADALQRLPSPLEPEGFGDNISCIVVKLT